LDWAKEALAEVEPGAKRLCEEADQAMKTVEAYRRIVQDLEKIKATQPLTPAPEPAPEPERINGHGHRDEVVLTGMTRNEVVEQLCEDGAIEDEDVIAPPSRGTLAEQIRADLSENGPATPAAIAKRLDLLTPVVRATIKAGIPTVGKIPGRSHTYGIRGCHGTEDAEPNDRSAESQKLDDKIIEYLYNVPGGEADREAVMQATGTSTKRLANLVNRELIRRVAGFGLALTGKGVQEAERAAQVG
jgi:hypothetical protein